MPVSLPKGYEWLGTVGILPKMVTEGLKTVGTLEVPGRGNSKTILGWAKETDLTKQGYSADSTPWCGLWMKLIAQRAGKLAPKYPLWALNWEGFGTQGNQPCLGDTLVFLRSGGGHVGIYIAEDKIAYHVLGGNQSDRVSITRVDKKRLHGVRRPEVRIAHASSAKPYVVLASGGLSENEA